jgi:hypothetical protein
MFEVGDVAHDANGMMTDIAHRLVDDILPPAGDDDPRAFLGEKLGGRPADAAIATGDNGDLVFETLHCLSPFN